MGLAVVGFLLLVGGVIFMLTSDAMSAVADVQKQISNFTEKATTFAAPGSEEVEFDVGGGVVMLSPGGTVGDKTIGTPPSDVTFTVTITDATGTAVEFAPNRSPRQPGAPFELIGFFETPTKGLYKIDVQTSTGVPAAIMVAAGTEEDVNKLAGSAGQIAAGAGGLCAAGCGGIMLLGFGIPALIVRAKAKKRVDPLANV